jgi:hypothetical protein
MLETQSSPFDYAITHLQALGWPAVIIGIIWVMRFLTKAETKLQDASQKFSEIHVAVTNHLEHGVAEAVTLLRKQDSRYESWLIGKATTHGD